MYKPKLSPFNIRNYPVGKEAWSNRTYCSFKVPDLVFKITSFCSLMMVIFSLPHEEIGDEVQP